LARDFKDDISVSDAAFEKIKASFNCTLVGEVKLKNKENPVKLYNVVD